MMLSDLQPFSPFSLFYPSSSHPSTLCSSHLLSALGPLGHSREGGSHLGCASIQLASLKGTYILRGWRQCLTHRADLRPSAALPGEVIWGVGWGGGEPSFLWQPLLRGAAWLPLSAIFLLDCISPSILHSFMKSSNQPTHQPLFDLLYSVPGCSYLLGK